ncbi:MAG: serine/threonine-protein kinase [Planctomycetota bacterium]
MKPDREHLVHVLFDAALESRPEDRDAFLNRSCGGDEALRSEVASLLAADARAASFLEVPALDSEFECPPDRPAAGLIGRQVGQYRLDGVIASGGMGSVYAASQESPHRVVAVKVLRSSMATPAILRRFEHESEVLAGLRHPGIAQVYEAGVFDDGAAAVPFFAMEYVPDANPITVYATEHRLDTGARLDLFTSVCDAVHHGHQKGVIHRDLKPANILVDAAGQPKIIDFGVARSFDSDIALTTFQTDMRQLVGTVQYMSPEQCAGDPHDIDIRTDVFALGVVLYELLGGRPPYDVTNLPSRRSVSFARRTRRGSARSTPPCGVTSRRSWPRRWNRSASDAISRRSSWRRTFEAIAPAGPSAPVRRALPISCGCSRVASGRSSRRWRWCFWSCSWALSGRASAWSRPTGSAWPQRPPRRTPSKKPRRPRRRSAFLRPCSARWIRRRRSGGR